VSGISNTYDNTSSLQQRLHQSTVQMPVGHVVSPNGRTGAELRVARDTYELVATGKSARLGNLLPHLTTTTNTGPNGHPIEVRLPFALLTWLVLGTLTITDEVAEFFVYMYVVGAERLGAACDMVLTGYDNDDPVSPSVLRRYFLDIAETLRVDQPVPFTVKASCLLLVGGMADNLECQNLAVPVVVPPLSPAWFVHTKFRAIAPKLSLLPLNQAEPLLSPRYLPAQRSANGGAAQLARLLLRALPEQEREIIEACGEWRWRSSLPRSSPRCCRRRLRWSSLLSRDRLPPSPSRARSRAPPCCSLLYSSLYRKLLYKAESRCIRRYTRTRIASRPSRAIQLYSAIHYTAIQLYSAIHYTTSTTPLCSHPTATQRYGILAMMKHP
jgi:hypothetical protein